MDKQIMIVDDNDFVRDSLEMFFQAEGIGIVTAANGWECLEHLEGGFKGVLLLDIQMPGIDGWETLKRMVEKDLQHENIIVMLTARVDGECQNPEVLKYVDDYIVKPFHPNDLLESVRRHAKELAQAQCLPH